MQVNKYLGRNHEKKFRGGKANCWAQGERVNASENLGKAAALPALPDYALKYNSIKMLYLLQATRYYRDTNTEESIYFRRLEF